jgi:negative regulator of flagellin synthesis FlgM
MVDPVGAKPVTQDRSLARVAQASPVARSRPVVQDPSETPAAGGLAALITDYAATPPVDVERVAEIRQAIANKTYPIVAETVADRMIAIKLYWRPE